MYSSIKYPQTNCGCFECATFYIPQLDGIGIMSRRYSGDSPLGIGFSKLAAYMSGGAQNNGCMGASVRGIMKRKFIQGDGGWKRIVWLDSGLKEEVASAIPEEIYDKIATETDTTDPMELKEFLVNKGHPIISEYWKDGEPVPLTLPGAGEDWPDEE